MIYHIYSIKVKKAAASSFCNHNMLNNFCTCHTIKPSKIMCVLGTSKLLSRYETLIKLLNTYNSTNSSLKLDDKISIKLSHIHVYKKNSITLSFSSCFKSCQCMSVCYKLCDMSQIFLALDNYSILLSPVRTLFVSLLFNKAYNIYNTTTNSFSS